MPILRSQQQGEILALLLGDPELELSLTEIAARVGAPHPSVYREVQRAEQAGLVTSRKIGNTRLVRANTSSPYYAGLAEVLTRAFGVPAVLAEALRDVDGITAACIHGSWAARHEGQPGQRPVADIEVLVLGEPDRDQLYVALSAAEQRLARPVQATIRDAYEVPGISSRPIIGGNRGLPELDTRRDHAGLVIIETALEQQEPDVLSRLILGRGRAQWQPWPRLPSSACYRSPIRRVVRI